MIRLQRSEPVFHCQQCGECCQGKGGIFPTQVEIALMAQYLKISAEELVLDYLEQTAMGLAVKNKTGEGCIFNKQGRCAIHPVKPRICRDWPFLPAIILHPTEFEAAKEACPGLNPNGNHPDFLKWWQEKII